MKQKTLFASMLVGVLAITGCMSLEERLASNDPTIKHNAEYELVANSRRTGNEAARIAAIKRVTNAELLMEIALTAHPEQKKKHSTVPSTIPDGMAALEKLTDQKSLSKIVTKADAEEVRLGAMERIKDQSLLLDLYKETHDDTIKKQILPRLNGASLAAVSYTANLIPYWKQIADQRVLAKIYRDGHQALNDTDKHELLGKLTDKKIIEEMITPPSRDKVEKYNNETSKRKQELHKRIQDAERKAKRCLESAKHDEKNYRFSSANKERAKAKELKEKIKKLQYELSTLKSTNDDFLYVTDLIGRDVLYAKVIPSTLIKMTKDKVESQSLQDWHNGNYDDLMTAAHMCGHITDIQAIGDVSVSVLDKIAKFRAKCSNGWRLSWGPKDREMAHAITTKVRAKLTDDMIESIIEKDRSTWEVLSDFFKDLTRASRLAVKYMGDARASGKETDLKAAFKRYGDTIIDDTALIRFSVENRVIRRVVFDKIKDAKNKEAALVAIKEQLNNELKITAEKQGRLSQFISEVGNGDDLIAWLKGKSGQTELQNKETFEKMKGKWIIVKGEVKNIGETRFANKTYVSLRVGKVGMFEHIDIQFNVPDSLKGTVKSWMKGEKHVMRGVLNSRGDMGDDAGCENGEIIPDEEFNEMIAVKGEMDCIKWQLRQIEENHVPAESINPSRFGTAVKAAADWVKSGVDDVKSSGDDLKKAAETLNGLFN